MAITTRFAPSPTGLLHLGHAFSARQAWRLARGAGGRFLLRIEDIDTTRCRPEYTDAILADLAWLGLDWDGPVWRQSERGAVYRAALDRLVAAGVAYPCFCTRADIAAAASAPHGPEGPVYPGTCRHLSAADRTARIAAGATPAWRLDSGAVSAAAGPLWFEDRNAGRVAVDPGLLGDIVIARRDIGTAYALAVVVDDAAQGITDIVRGRDLFEATHPQRLLQAALGLPAPRYHHHRLLTGPDGRRLAKRDRAVTLASLREAGRTPSEVLAMLDAQPPAGSRDGADG